MAWKADAPAGQKKKKNPIRSLTPEHKRPFKPMQTGETLVLSPLIS